MTVRVAFLDRDGTIITKAAEGCYTSAPEQVRLLPGAIDGLRALSAAHFRCIVVTNQRGVALGTMSAADYFAVHRRMLELLASSGVRLAAEFHCFHDRDQCDCRKPATGLLEDAAQSLHNYTKESSFMVGDADSDVECAARFGVPAIRIADRDDPRAAYTARNLYQAAEWMVAQVNTDRPANG